MCITSEQNAVVGIGILCGGCGRQIDAGIAGVVVTGVDGFEDGIVFYLSRIGQ